MADKKKRKKYEELEELGEGKLTARVYDSKGNLKKEVENVRVKGDGAIVRKKEKKPDKKGFDKSWKKK